jgi:3-dehydroquinate dehydratase-2
MTRCGAFQPAWNPAPGRPVADSRRNAAPSALQFAANHRQIAGNLVKLAGISVECELEGLLLRLMAHLLLLNGPNLNLVGTREPSTYGAVTLEQIVARLGQLAAEAGHHLSAFQSNAEAELITRIHEAPATHVAFIIFNPAAFTHTSIALRDALLAVKIPFIEVHLSNVHAREPFRHHSYFSDIALGTITGLGAVGYELALRAAAHHLAPARK